MTLIYERNVYWEIFWRLFWGYNKQSRQEGTNRYGLDVQKSYDSLSHKTLLYKTEPHEIWINMLFWMEYWLIKQELRIKVHKIKGQRNFVGQAASVGNGQMTFRVRAHLQTDWEGDFYVTGCDKRSALWLVSRDPNVHHYISDLDNWAKFRESVAKALANQRSLNINTILHAVGTIYVLIPSQLT